MSIDIDTVQSIATRYRDAYAAFVEGRSGVSPSEILKDALAEYPTGRRLAILRKMVPPEARISGKNTLAGLLHDANTHFGAEAYRSSNASAGAVSPTPTGKEIVLRNKPGLLVRTVDPAAEAVDGGASVSRPKLSYRIHQVAGTAEVGGPGVYKGPLPINRSLVPITTTPASEVPVAAATQVGGRLSRLGKLLPRGALKWGGRALGVLAVADGIMRLQSLTQGRDDRLRSQRALGSEADLRASSKLADIREEEQRGRLLDDALMFNNAADTAQLLNAQGAASQQVKLELSKQRSDLLGIAMRSEPTVIEQVAAMQRFMGGR